MSRRDVYEERSDRAYYEQARAPRAPSPLPVRVRERERESRELPDVYYQRPVEENQVMVRRSDYSREVSGPPPRDEEMVLRKRDVETYRRPVRRERSPSIERVRERERFVQRERAQSVDSRPRYREPSVERVRATTRVVERERERSPEVVYRREQRYVERERSPSPLYDTERVQRTSTTRVVERQRSPSPVYNREKVTTRSREVVRARTPSPDIVERTTNVRIVERERERRRTPSPVSSSSSSEEEVRMVPAPQPVIHAPPIHQEVITHHRHINHGFEYQPAMVPAPMPTPPPPPRVRTPSPPRVRQEMRETQIDIDTTRGQTDIDIYRSRRVEERSRSRSRERRRPDFYDDDVLFEREREPERLRARTSMQRSVSVNREQRFSHSTSDLPRLRNDQSEEDYYARKVEERARIGEAYNGATKGWEIVDVPPGTERVRLDGVGGASQEITWQKYNGVRRSKFIPGTDSMRDYDRGMELERSRGAASFERERETEITRERERAPPPPVQDRSLEVSNSISINVNSNRERAMGMPPPMPKRDRWGGMWTEITKDLVVREAIEEIGYDYEETEFFFYVFQYLRYEDVVELVDLSRHIRRQRQQRIREIAWERDHTPRRERHGDMKMLRGNEEEERIREREIVYGMPMGRRAEEKKERRRERTKVYYERG